MKFPMYVWMQARLVLDLIGQLMVGEPGSL